MKTTRISVALLAAVTLAVTACKTDLTGLNVDPNNPSIDTPPPPGTIFTRAVATTGQRVGGAAYQLSMMELLAQHVAQVQYVDEDRFSYRVGNMQLFFDNPYFGDLMDYQQVVQIGQKTSDASIWGPAKVMQQYVFQNMTDTWGDIPYSQALGGMTGVGKPAYDAQKDIYYGMLKSLTDAVTAMSAGSALGSTDQLYGGDVAKWRKFANALRLRMAMRIQKADAAKATAELAAAIAAPGGLLASNSDNAKIAWPGDQTFDNPWAANFSTRDDHRVSKTLLDVMVPLNDPRVPLYAQPTVSDATKYTGLQNGLDNPTANSFFNTTSRLGTMFFPGKTAYGTYGTSAGRATPTYLLTYAEQNFILAEAANRGIGGLASSAAKGYYDAGVSASITQWGGTSAQASAYLADPNVAYQSGAAGLTQILTQKWIALFSQGGESWSDWRRTGIPASIAPGPKALFTTMPRRMQYSVTEQSVNNDALLAAIARQGADALSTRMWWDK